MKKLLIFLLVLALIDVALLFVNWEESRTGRGDTIQVGLVFDVGGRGDKSFNDSAFRGLDRARRELGIEMEYIEPGEGADRESALRVFAGRHFDLIIGVGFMFTDDINLLAREFPHLRFACVDYALRKGSDGQVIPPPSNVAAIKFREEEGSFLVGALAGLRTGSKKVGFVGGMNIPLIHRFEDGYKAGVAHVCPSCRTYVNYAGVTSGAFKDPGKGKELGLAQYHAGVDIIYHASGSTGLGVFKAAQLNRKLAIGVDSDQYHEAPGNILTSMLKKVDNAVFETIKSVLENRFAGGIKSFGLKEQGLDYVYDGNNRDLIGLEIHKQVEEIRQQIIGQEIHVKHRYKD